MDLCWQSNDSFKTLLKDQGVSSGPDPGTVLPFTKIVGIILPLTSMWKCPAYENEPHHILRPRSPSAMAHTLCVEGASLWIGINPLLTYHFFSHWIHSVMRHQEPELHQVLKPGTMDFGWVWVPAAWVHVPSKVLAGFKSQSLVNSLIARGPLSIPLLMSTSEAFSVPFYILIKLCKLLN